jgi:5-methylthioadenosine/S-adenosylhomocysteine deaminase
VPPEAVLELATRDSARALGLHAHIGSIEPGKAADLIAVDLRVLGTQPAQAAAEALLFGATRAQVSDVWIGGRAALAGGRLLAFDEEELLASARSWDQRLPGAAAYASARLAALGV